MRCSYLEQPQAKSSPLIPPDCPARKTQQHPVCGGEQQNPDLSPSASVNPVELTTSRVFRVRGPFVESELPNLVRSLCRSAVSGMELIRKAPAAISRKNTTARHPIYANLQTVVVISALCTLGCDSRRFLQLEGVRQIPEFCGYCPMSFVCKGTITWDNHLIESLSLRGLRCNGARFRT